MNSTMAVGIAGPGRRSLWRAAQAAALAGTLALIGALFTVPDVALRVLWDMAIPVLPAVFLISPGLWRNICPLATLNMLPSRLGGRRVLDDRWIPAAGVVGVVLLVLMVPARRFLFNTDGTVLAVTIVLVAVLALVLGAVFDKKAGFCNSICPVLPVERLYGQRQLFDSGNPRCVPCTVCTTRGCIEIAQSKSIAQTLGRVRRSHAWLQSGFGAFAAGFPGFIIGYNLTQDGGPATAGAVYLTVAMWTASSYVVAHLVVRAFGLGSAVAVRLLGALSIGLYYWFAGPVVSEHLAFPAWTGTAIRGAAFALIAIWLLRADGTHPLRGTDAGAALT